MPDPSHRAQIVAYVRQKLVSSGYARGATDAPPGEYVLKGPDWSWVFEGYEVKSDLRKLHNKTERTLELHIHRTYTYRPDDEVRGLNPTGRELLAQQQELIMRDYQLGGLAWLTEEGGNGIGVPVGTEKPLGILATVWLVHYDTPTTDPRA